MAEPEESRPVGIENNDASEADAFEQTLPDAAAVQDTSAVGEETNGKRSGLKTLQEHSILNGRYRKNVLPTITSSPSDKT